MSRNKYKNKNKLTDLEVEQKISYKDLFGQRRGFDGRTKVTSPLLEELVNEAEKQFSDSPSPSVKDPKTTSDKSLDKGNIK